MDQNPLSAPISTTIPVRMVAVIDIGATSLRMQIAEIQSTGKIRKLESFSQAVSLGKDSFATGEIAKETIEDCIHVLKIYRSKINEYGIVDRDQIRVIATSGVREASNRMAFADRVFIATGFEIAPFEEAEIHRVTYFGILPFLRDQPELFQGDTMIVEVGGGTTEVLILDKADVAFSRSFRMGGLRLRNAIDRYDAPPSKSRSVMETQILQSVKQLRDSCQIESFDNYIAMGGDVRFAAKEINQQPVGEGMVSLRVSDLKSFTEKILKQPPSKLATRFHMSLPDAQTLGPGLLAQLTFAQQFNMKHLLVANVSLRDGLLKEMAEGKGWSASIHSQVVRSAIQTGQKYNFQQEHAEHVARLACDLFDQLQSLHVLPIRFRRILEISALLHEIGAFVNYKSRHKHSMYLIQNSEFFGIATNSLELISLVARYHRGASPQPRHEGYSRLDRIQRVAVSKLAAILRVAKALDISLSQRIQSVSCQVTARQLEMVTHDVADLSMEQLELSQSVDLFEAIFGKQPVLSNVSSEA